MSETELTFYERHHTAVRVVIALLAAAVVVVVFLPSLIAPWSRLNNTEEEMDLYSGRVRTTRYFLWMQIARKIDETPMSKALGDDANPQERWVRTATFQPFRHVSPQYVHSRAPCAIVRLAAIWKKHGFTAEARGKTARQLLRVLRRPNVSAVGRWFDALQEISDGRSPDVPVEAEDIPDDLDEKALAAEADDHQHTTATTPAGGTFSSAATGPTIPVRPPSAAGPMASGPPTKHRACLSASARRLHRPQQAEKLRPMVQIP
jgi:hypothetical protein